jgi:hypothetical protein
MDRQSLQDKLRTRVIAAFVAAAALLVAAVIFDAVGTLGNVVADVLLASTITVTYHVLVSRRRRHIAEDLQGICSGHCKLNCDLLRTKSMRATRPFTG